MPGSLRVLLIVTVISCGFGVRAFASPQAEAARKIEKPEPRSEVDKAANSRGATGNASKKGSLDPNKRTAANTNAAKTSSLERASSKGSFSNQKSQPLEKPASESSDKEKEYEKHLHSAHGCERLEGAAREDCKLREKKPR
jgi:hypothetical protein